MSAGDIDIRYSVTSGLFRTLEGLGIAAFGFVVFWSDSSFVTDTGAHRHGFAMFLAVVAPVGFGMAFFGAYRLVDRRVKLSLTDEGLADRRTETLVRWGDFFGVRLEERRTYGGLMTARLLVRMADNREVAFNILGLSLPHEEIERLVRERVQRARA